MEGVLGAVGADAGGSHEHYGTRLYVITSPQVLEPLLLFAR